MRRIIRVLFYPTCILLITIILRVFFIEMFWVPSASMEPEIKKKSYILIEKLSYGSKLPTSLSEIPWLNSLLFLSNKFECVLNKKRWSDQRIFARLPQKGDVLVFQSMKGSSFLVKRCVGVAGDVLTVDRDIWFCNEDTCSYSDYLLYDFIIDSKNDIVDEILTNSSFHRWGEVYQSKLVECICLSGKQIKEFSKKEILKYLKVKAINFELNKTQIKIPKAGDIVEITPLNYLFYAKAINKYEEQKIEIINTHIYINNLRSNHYTFQNDYFFMMGDNRSRSIDSREFGLIPFKQIVGKLLFK